MPHLERILPTAVWEQFSAQFGRATGLRTVLLDRDGQVVASGADPDTLCAGGGEPCSRTYRKAAQQALAGGEAVLLRCPHGFLVFATPVEVNDGDEPLVLIGGPALAKPLDTEGEETLVRRLGTEVAEAEAFVRRVPVVAPRVLLESAHLAQFCLQSVAAGNSLKESYARRQSQVITLFEVSSDLSLATSEHELYALALNILGVLFDVECAAILLLDPAGGGYRTQTAMGGLEKVLQGWNLAADAAPLTGNPVAGKVIRVGEAHTLGKLGLPEDVEQITVVQLGAGTGPPGLLVLVNVALAAGDEQMIRGFAIQLALVMEKQQLRAAIEGKARELQAVQDTSRQFLSCLDPDELFAAVLGEARKITGARKGSLMLAASGGEELAVKAVSGMNGAVVSKLRVRSGQGVAGKVFATGEPILVQNIEQDARFERKNRPRYATRSFLSLPITMDGRIVGVLNVSDKVSGEIFREEDLRLLQTVANQATIAIERSNYYIQSLELRKISITDPLTSLLNRRYFQERLAEEVDRSARHGKPLSLMMIDADHFKLYNDGNGHPAGDKALVMIARALRDGVRTIDVVSRFGGEEFAVILPETSKDEALEIGERLRQEIEAVYFPGEETLPGQRLTVSLGVATFAEDARDLKSLIQRADRALYQAKAQGRNVIVPYNSPRPPTEPEPASQPWTRLL